eukprot:XP_015580475.1 2-succinylbenzoate--CoA ligase, chloroplastic/peroxisomal [Ricinus communis]
MSNYSQAHICQCLTRLSTLRPNSIVTITGNRQTTGKQFVENVLSLAGGLTKLGLRKGDIVAICAFNSDLYLEWLLAVAFIGGIVAPLNYRWSFEEAKSAMLSVKAVMFVADESCSFWYSELKINSIPSLMWHVFLDFSSSSVIQASNILTTDTLRKQGIGSPELNYSWAPERAVLICFTSGTTGRPKGVLISHSALTVQSLAKVAFVGYCEDDVYLHTAPLCHIGGLSSAMAMLMVGACHVFIPKFNASLAVDVIDQHNVTSLITVPATMGDLISLTREKETWKGRHTLKKMLNGGGSLSVGLIKDASIYYRDYFLLTCFEGMTESCSSLTFMTLYDPTLETPDQLLQTYGRTKLTSVNQPQGVCVGKPAPHVEIKICPDGSSHSGRILTRGPHAMLRYWDQTPSEASDRTNEIWLDTGDIGIIDGSGNLWLIGRANNRIKSGGENVHPEEVEAILLQHPGVAAAIVLGIPDARLMEMVVACIRLREGWRWSNDDCKPLAGKEILLCSEILQKYCREKNLSRFKVPKIFIIWRKPFPLTTSGKIRRDQIRGEVTSHLQFLPSSL